MSAIGQVSTYTTVSAVQPEVQTQAPQQAPAQKQIGSGGDGDYTSPAARAQATHRDGNVVYGSVNVIA
jgi:hypothetical protein